MSDPIVYFNGSFVARSEVAVSPDDRGFLFGDGVYEVVRFYGGAPFGMDAHLARLRRSLGELRIEGVDVEAIESVIPELVRRNHLDDALVYLQVTRGAAPRQHSFPPDGTRPTVYAFANLCRPDPSLWDRGSTAITVPDERWGRCDVKSLNLLGNVLANQAAQEAGVDEAILVRDGVVTEGSHTNVAVVSEGTLRTHPEGPAILSGVTRGKVLALAAELGIPVREEPITLANLFVADEAMIFSTREEVMPVVEIDGRAIGEGRPGPITRRLLAAFRERLPGATAAQPASR